MSNYLDRGKKCSIWGKMAEDMTRDELLGFIGILDSRIENTEKDLRASEHKLYKKTVKETKNE